MNPTKNTRKYMESVIDMIESGEPQDPEHIQFASEVALYVFQSVQKIRPVVSCETCYFFESGICRKADAAPPENIIQKGCELWLDKTLDPWDQEMWDATGSSLAAV